MAELRFEGKVAIVTGGGPGPRRAYARRSPHAVARCW